MKTSIHFRIMRSNIALPLNIEWEIENAHSYKQEGVDCSKCPQSGSLKIDCEPCIENDIIGLSIYVRILIFCITIYMVDKRPHRKEIKR